MLKKLKKGLKKAAKVAVPVGAALLAARALKKRNARNARNAMMNSATSNDGFSNDFIGKLAPEGPLIMNDGFIKPGVIGDGYAAKGGSAGRKKRSTITGVAVRGFGRALKSKGKK